MTSNAYTGPQRPELPARFVTKKIANLDENNGLCVHREEFDMLKYLHLLDLVFWHWHILKKLK